MDINWRKLEEMVRDWEAWQPTVHRVEKRRVQLNRILVPEQQQKGYCPYFPGEKTISPVDRRRIKD